MAKAYELLGLQIVTCWFYSFDLIDVIQQAGFGPAQQQDLATCCLIVRGQVYVGGVVYKHYVILYDHICCIQFIIQYTDLLHIYSFIAST